LGAAPNPSKQRKALQQIDEIAADSKNVWVVHYSCESFYDRKDGTSPRITSIAVRRLTDAQTKSFSIHQLAERKKIKFKDIDKKYDQLERMMLDEYFKFIGSHQNVKYLHWNMRDANYGFAAIEHRYSVLGGAPHLLNDLHKFDLARLLIDIYGVGYVGHPRLEKLLEKNSIAALDYLNGAGEAKAFEEKNYVALHQSTLRKVDVLANIFHRVHDRQLKTNTTWWEMHGGKARTFINWLAENKIVGLIIAITGLVLSLYVFL
jgi:hypothetical protein